MASKRGINYQWRLFLPAVIAFWIVIIGMAGWQVWRISQVKKYLVYDQLAIVGERVADYLNNDKITSVQPFMQFVDRHYSKARNYDMITVLMRHDPEYGDVMLNNGDNLPFDLDLPSKKNQRGTYTPSKKDFSEYPNLASKYLYYATTTNDGREVYVLLPYTKEVANVLSASTTRFWLIFFSIAIFVTIFVYISTAYLGRNVRILRDFAQQAARNPDFVSPDTYEFPHDEFGDISRQILHIYNQRMAEIENREREHRVAMHAIEDKERIKRELSGNINHELKTPVGVIQGYIDTIVEDPNMDEKTKQRFLLKTQENVHRLSSLIADITAITKLESGGKLVNVTDVNFHDLVFTFDNYINEAGVLKKGMVFSYDIPLGCIVLGNESLMSSVLLNLVKNAVAYSQGTMCRVECVGEDQEYYHFAFYDDGIGVPPEHLPHMFERFYRVNSGRSREAGGTGLGLSIVEVAINSFGGHIEVTNRYPSGLQFNFSLKKYKRNKNA